MEMWLAANANVYVSVITVMRSVMLEINLHTWGKC